MSILKVKLLAIFLAVAFSGFAQSITWQDVSSNYTFPEGLKLFHGTRTGNNTFFAYYYEVDLNVETIGVRPYFKTPFAQVHTFSGEVGAYGAINAGFFSASASVSSVVYPGQVIATNITSVTRDGKTYPIIRPLFAINNDKRPATKWVYHHSPQLNDLYFYQQPLAYVCDDQSPRPAPLKANGTQYQNIAYGIGGGPQLIKNGVINITYCQEVFWGSGILLTDYRPRTAVGFTQNNRVMLFVTNTMLISEVAETLLALGCHEAINLDGGSSTAMAVGGTTLYNQGRAVPTILAVVHKDALQIPELPTFERIIDTGDLGTSSSGTWFATANPGSWGTPSLLHSRGTNDVFYQFSLNLPKAGEYEIFAWWTAASNRATDTPFLITRAGGVSEVRMNQAINGSTWNLLGKFNFNGTADERVRVTAAATTNDFVVADAIKIVSYDPGFNTRIPAVDELIASQLKVFPNPSKGFFQVESPSGVEGNFQVFSLDGRLVNKGVINRGTSTFVDLSAQPSGVFFLKFLGQHQSGVTKIVKN